MTRELLLVGRVTKITPVEEQEGVSPSEEKVNTGETNE